MSTENLVNVRHAIARVYNPDRTFDNVTVNETIISDTIEDTSGNPYIRSESNESVVLGNLEITGGLLVNSITGTTDGYPYIRYTDTNGLLILDNTPVETLQVDTIVSDKVQRTDGQSYLSLEPGITGTARRDPQTIPLNSDVFTNMAVDGDFVQFNGTMRGNAKYLTSFAEKENISLEKRLEDYAKSAERRYYVSAFDGNDTNHGKSRDKAFKTIRRACEVAEPKSTIFVASGDYYEVVPIFVRPNVAIIGDSLRNVFLHTKSWEYRVNHPDGKGVRSAIVGGINYNRLDFFHLSTTTYLYGLRFKDMEAPGYCAAFPSAITENTIDSGKMSSIEVLYSPDGYFLEDRPLTGPASEWKPETRVSGVLIANQTTTPYPEAAAVLNSAKSAIQEGVIAHVNSELKDDIAGWNVTLESKCRRDVGYIVDAVVRDLKSGGFEYTREASEAYYEGTVNTLESSQITPTADAIVFLRGEINDLLGNNADDKVSAAAKRSRELVNGIINTLRTTNGSHDTYQADVFTKVSIEGIFITSGGSSYSLNTRIDIDAPAAIADSGRPTAGVRAQARIAEVDVNGSIVSVTTTEPGRGYDKEYEELNKNIVNAISNTGENAILEPIYNVEQFVAWAEEGGVRKPCGQLFSELYGTTPSWSQGEFETTRAYRSSNGTLDSDDYYTDGPPTITLSHRVPGGISTFPDAAELNPGGFNDLADDLAAKKETILNEFIGGLGLSEVPRTKCRRDSEYIFDAIVFDLRNGSYVKSSQVANSYYEGTNRNTVFTDTRAETATAIRNLATRMNNAANSEYKQDVIVTALLDGIADSILSSNPRLANPPSPEAFIPYPKTYVAYKLHGSNLWKWRLEARQTIHDEWTILDQRDFTFLVNPSDELDVTPVFNSTASGNVGGFESAYTILASRREAIQNELIQWVEEYFASTTGVSLTTKQTDLCRRDTGYIVDAIALDLLFGGFRKSAYAAVRYYKGSASVLPIEQVQPTVDALNELKKILEGALEGEDGASEAQALLQGIIETIEKPIRSVDGRHGIKTPGVYQYYRLVMLQNNERSVSDTATMKVARMEFFERDVPDIYIDGPDIQNTRVVGVDIVDGGSGYNNQPTVTIKAPDGDTQPIRLAEAEADVVLNRIVRIRVTSNGDPYPGGRAVVEITPHPSDTSVTPAQATVLMGDSFASASVSEFEWDTGRVKEIQINDPGYGYTKIPGVSVRAPERMRPFVTGSPYVQNCSNISGPWTFDANGDHWKVSERHPLPYPLDDVYRDVTETIKHTIDPDGSGGGIRIDGAAPKSASPLRSFVVDAFTQVNQGGVGFLLTNRAYAQFVSTFGTFCSTHMKALGGSFANASNSVTDFGTIGLEARGYWPEPFTRAKVVAPGSATQTTWSTGAGMFIPDAGYRSDVSSISFVGGAEETTTFTTSDTITVEIESPPPSGFAKTAKVEGTPSGNVVTLDLTTALTPDFKLKIPTLVTESGLGIYGQDSKTFRGIGYMFTPNVTLKVNGNEYDEDNNPGIPRLVSALSGVSTIRISVLEGRRPDFLSIARIHGGWYTVQSANQAFKADDSGEEIAGQYDVTFFPSPNFVNLDLEIEFFSVSYLSTGSHVMEYVGSGITYNALPEYGGIPLRGNEIEYSDPARVFFTTSDQLGNSKIGELFSVDQTTGSISFSAETFDLSDVSGIGPFKRNGVRVGEKLLEVSNDVNLRSAATGTADSNTVPTQFAVQEYVRPRAVPQPTFGQTDYFLRAQPGGDTVKFLWKQLQAGDVGLEETSLRTDVLTGMYVDGDARIYGNANIGTVQITDAAKETQLFKGGLTVFVNTEQTPPALTFRYRALDGTTYETTQTMSSVV